MKNSIFITLCSLLLTTTISAHATKTIGDPTQIFKEKFESKVTELYQEYHLQGDFLVGVVGENGLIYSQVINKQSINGEKSSINNNTPFFIASHTKAMTGTLLKILEEEGLVNLNKSLYDYLPELISNNKINAKTITVRQLLNHTSGFTSTMHSFKTAFLGATEGEKELIEALNNKILSAPAGKFRYSNTGPIIAGMIVEKVTGNSWQEEMHKRIFLPLQMNMTSAKVSDYPVGSILPSIETTTSNTIFRSGFYKTDNTMHAAGGTITTMHDMAKWLKFNITEEISIIKDKKSFSELHQATTTQKKTYFTYERVGYSLGWDIATYHGETILTRFGGYGGISFHASFMPSKKLGIIAFSNDERAYTLPHLTANYLYNLASGNKSADMIFEQEKLSFKKAFDSQNKQALSIAMLLDSTNANDKLIGTYKSDDNWPLITITKSNNRYSFKWGELSGPILSNNNSEQPFLAALGPLNRVFSVQIRKGKIITLTNGSLKYTKIK